MKNVYLRNTENKKPQLLAFTENKKPPTPKYEGKKYFLFENDFYRRLFENTPKETLRNKKYFSEVPGFVRYKPKTGKI